MGSCCCVGCCGGIVGIGAARTGAVPPVKLLRWPPPMELRTFAWGQPEGSWLKYICCCCCICCCIAGAGGE